MRVVGVLKGLLWEMTISAKADRQLIAATADGWATGEDQNMHEGNHPSDVAYLS